MEVALYIIHTVCIQATYTYTSDCLESTWLERGQLLWLDISFKYARQAKRGATNRVFFFEVLDCRWFHWAKRSVTARVCSFKKWFWMPLNTRFVQRLNVIFRRANRAKRSATARVSFLVVLGTSKFTSCSTLGSARFQQLDIIFR